MTFATLVLPAVAFAGREAGVEVAGFGLGAATGVKTTLGACKVELLEITGAVFVSATIRCASLAAAEEEEADAESDEVAAAAA